MNTVARRVPSGVLRAYADDIAIVHPDIFADIAVLGRTSASTSGSLGWR